MDTLLDEDELMIRNTARDILRVESTPASVRSAETASHGLSRDLWRKVASLGWCGLCLPEEAGGQGAPLAYMGLLLQEAGRFIAPIPLASSAAASCVLADHGGAAFAGDIARIAEGALILTFAMTEASGAWDPDAVAATGRRDGDRIVLNGTKTFVDGIGLAHKALVVFRLEDEPGHALALVDVDAPGVSIERLINSARNDQCNLLLDGVGVDTGMLVAEGEAGTAATRRLMELASVFAALQMVGAAQQATAMAVDYSKIRIAFGQPIGSFQSLQHMAADMTIGTDGAELLAYEALWRMDQGLSAALEVSQAKSFANIHCLAACRSAQQMHGGLGFIKDFDLHLWYRNVVTWGLCAGSVADHRRIIAAEILDVESDVRLDDCHVA